MNVNVTNICYLKKLKEYKSKLGMLIYNARGLFILLIIKTFFQTFEHYIIF